MCRNQFLYGACADCNGLHLKKCSISLAILKNRLWKLTRMISIYNPEQNLPGVFTAMDFSKRIY